MRIPAVLLLLLLGTIAHADAPTCKFSEQLKDRYGCLPIRYLLESSGCRVALGSCFRIQIEEIPRPTRQVKKVLVSVYGQGASKARAQEACRQVLESKTFGSLCETAKVERSSEPFRVEMEVVEVE